MVLLNLKDRTGNKSLNFAKTRYLNSWVSLQVISKLQMESEVCSAPILNVSKQIPFSGASYKSSDYRFKKRAGLGNTFLDPFFHMGGIERDDIAEAGEALAVCPK